MIFQRIEIIATPENGLTVIVDKVFADHLMRDEALGVVAAALFSESAHKLPYVKSYESWIAWQSKYYDDIQPVAAIEDRRVIAKVNARLWPKEFLKLQLQTKG